jgi:uncharacterized protein (TIGR03435 family)
VGPASSTLATRDDRFADRRLPMPAAALKKQLGLKLRTTKTAIDVLVVDHADPAPTEN